MADDLSRIDEMLTVAREHYQIRLHDIEVGQHDIERRVQDDATVSARVFLQRKVKARRHDLVQRNR